MCEAPAGSTRPKLLWKSGRASSAAEVDDKLEAERFGDAMCGDVSACGRLRGPQKSQIFKPDARSCPLLAACGPAHSTATNGHFRTYVPAKTGQSRATVTPPHRLAARPRHRCPQRAMR